MLGGSGGGRDETESDNEIVEENLHRRPFDGRVSAREILAVLVDAFIVRATLVPALMKLAGSWNWWAPAPLRRLHDHIGISESVPVEAVPVEPVPVGPSVHEPDDVTVSA